MPSRATKWLFGCHTTRKPRTDVLDWACESWINSDLFRNRAVLGNVTAPSSRHTADCYFEAMRTERFLRPFALLRLITRRPFLVAMRTRNPWVRFRDTLLGWKVRFIFVYLDSISFQKWVIKHNCLCVSSLLLQLYIREANLICLEKQGQLWYPAVEINLILSRIRSKRLFSINKKVINRCWK